MLNEQIFHATPNDHTEAPIRPQAEEKHEVELKFLAPAGVLDELRKAPVITRRAIDHGVASQLDTIYYDTTDQELYRYGLSLRVRRSGGGYVQTLKRGPVHGRPFTRGEWETPIASIAPDPALLPVSEIGPALARFAANTFDPIFETKVSRWTQRLELPGAVVEVAFDEGSIEAGDRSELLTEIELEMKAGDPRALYDLGIELLDIAPLRIGTRSKAECGYGLAFGLAPAAAKATVPAITADQTVDHVIGELLAVCQQQLLANQAVVEDGHDPEGVHQMRVALRRLRTAFALLRSELGSPTLQAFGAEAKWLAKLLGAARDWDVFVTQTLNAPSGALPSDIVDLDGLREAAEPHRAVAYAHLRETLASKRYSRFQLLLRRWIESRGWRGELQSGALAALLEPSREFAARALARLHGKALKRGRHFRHLGPDARHQLRIALKKLRYTVEFFKELYQDSADVKGYLGCLSKLQNSLGHDNDASMTWPLLCTLARDQTELKAQRSLGAVMGWQARDRIEVGLAMHKHWRQFKTIPTFW
jgi:inorganic triphosphatase YgiF